MKEEVKSHFLKGRARLRVKKACKTDPPWTRSREKRQTGDDKNSDSGLQAQGDENGKRSPEVADIPTMSAFLSEVFRFLRPA